MFNPRVADAITGIHIVTHGHAAAYSIESPSGIYVERFELMSPQACSRPMKPCNLSDDINEPMRGDADDKFTNPRINR